MRLIDADAMKELWQGCEIKGSIAPLLDVRPTINAIPIPRIVDSLKKLSRDHRHNYIINSHEERAWRLGIEDSIDLLLAESEVEK